MKITKVVLATAALALALPATAHADSDRVTFSSPSGNIRCALEIEDGTDAYVACQLDDIDYVVPAGVAHDDNGKPCPQNTGSGNDVMLKQGQPGYVRCSYAALGGGVGPWPTLAYGDSTSLGAITCTSESSALNCTDTGTGHFFRISRDAYDVG